jgi:hypothetical protein
MITSLIKIDLIKYFTNNAKDFHYPCKSQVLFLQLLIEKSWRDYKCRAHLVSWK